MDIHEKADLVEDLIWLRQRGFLTICNGGGEYPHIILNWWKVNYFLKGQGGYWAHEGEYLVDVVSRIRSVVEKYLEEKEEAKRRIYSFEGWQ